MSTNNNYAQSALLSYNKEKKSSASSQTNKMFSASYGTKYEASYDKVKNYKNFSNRMWQDSLKYGDTDTYLAFMEQSKDDEMSSQFYDPLYYDYETQMLELHKRNADTTNMEERFKQVYNPLDNTWNDESLGQMTDADYIDYQIKQSREVKAQQIQLTLDAARKNAMSLPNKVGNTVLATAGEFGEGVLSAVTGLIDTVISPIYANIEAAQGKDWLDSFVDYFAKDGLTAAERNNIRAGLSDYERKNTLIADVNGNPTTIGNAVASIANSMGMMVPSIIANAATGGAASLSWVGTATFYSSVFAGNMYENGNDPNRAGSPSWLKISNAAIKTGAEIVVERALDKFLGTTIQNKMLGINNPSVKGITAAQLTRGAGIGYIFKSAGQEGLEEFLQDFSTNLVDKFCDSLHEGYGNTGVTFQTLIDSFVIGALSSLLLSGGAIALDATRTKIANKTIERTTGVKDGAELFVENKDGSLKKLTGSTKMYYKSIISDLQNAIETLKTDGLNNKKNTLLAKEVFTAIDTMSDLFASFNTERLTNAEKLLNTLEQDDIASYNNFVNSISKEFESMLGGVQYRAELRKIIQSFKNKAKELSAAKVTKVNKVIDINGNEFKKQKSDDIIELEEVIAANGKNAKNAKNAKKTTAKAFDTTRDLLHNYDFIVVTDGHIAIEDDNLLYISESWLDNYETSEIYKFLAQNKILKSIIETKELKPFLNDLVKFNKEFTGQNDMSYENALMNFLFNESVFEAFLLKDCGKNLFAHKDESFRIATLLKVLGDDNIYTNTRTKLETKKLRAAYLNKVFDDIKDVMRKPVIKAVLNWNLDIQQIGANEILDETDIEYINQYQTRKAVINGGDTVKQEHKETKATLMEIGEFTNTEKDIIDKGEENNATPKEKLTSRLLLDLADNYAESSESSHLTLSKSIVAIENIVRTGFDMDVNKLFYTLHDLLELAYIQDTDKNVIMNAFEECVDILASAEGSKNIPRPSKELMTKSIKVLRTLEKIDSNIKTNMREQANQKKHTLNMSAFDVPYLHCMTPGKNGLARIQYLTNKLNAFKERYGIDIQETITPMHSPEMLFDKSTQSQKEAFFTDMKELGITPDIVVNEETGIKTYCYTTFLRNKLEIMLGNNYQVAFSYIQREDGLRYLSVDIVDKVIAEDVINSTLFTNGNSKDILGNETFIKFCEDNKVSNSNRTVPLYKFLREDIDIEELPIALKLALTDWSVTISNDADDSLGYTDAEESLIVIANNSDDSMLDTLIHEMNHVLQYVYYYSNGSSTSIMKHNRKYMQHILTEYRAVIEYHCRRSHYKGIIPNDINEASKELIDRISYVCYLAVDGEIKARQFAHNKDAVGAKSVVDIFNREIGFTLDNKVFEFKNKKSWQESKKEKPVVDSKNDVDYKEVFDNILEVRRLEEDDITGEAYKSNVRNTYHSRLSKSSSLDILSSITDKNLSKISLVLATIDKIIKNPEMYLSEEILQLIGDDMSEGHVFYFLKDYLEKRFDNISLDRSSSTHEYILVDDNAFDDIFVQDMRSRANDGKSTYIVDNYSNKGVKLSEFYNRDILLKMGIYPDLKIYISPTTETATTPLKGQAFGIITINADKFTSDAEILNKLNHEFRHLLQLSNKFETGFNTNFIVTPEMIADIRKHVPEIFNDKDLIANARRQGIAKDEYIASHFIYYLVGGEINAYGFKASILNGKPIYVSTVGGNINIFMPWYDARNGKGMYVTQDKSLKKDLSLAMKQEDAKNVTPQDDKKEVTQYDKIDIQNLLKTRFDDLIAETIADSKLEGKDAKNLASIIKQGEGIKKKADELKTKDKAKSVLYNKYYSMYKKIMTKLLAYNEELMNMSEEDFKNEMVQNAVTARADKAKKKSNEPIEKVGKKLKDAADIKKKLVTEYTKGIETVQRKPKYADKAVTKDAEGIAKSIYAYEEKRYVSHTEAKKSNLKYYVKTGERIQMDTDTRNFIESTTSDENQLPVAVRNAIHKGKLTKQSLMKWFRQTDADSINEFTFNAINKAFFHNDYISNINELDEIIEIEPSYYWAAASILRREGISLESLTIENDLVSFLQLMKSLVGTKWMDSINKMRLKFDVYHGYILDEKLKNYMRVLMMQYFDGTISGAFYASNALRKIIKSYAEEENYRVTSIETQTNKGLAAYWGDKTTTIGDTIKSDDNLLNVTENQIGNDIEALYEYQVGASTEEMRTALIKSTFDEEVEKVASEMAKSEEDKAKLINRLKRPDAVKDKIAELERKKDEGNITDKEVKILKRLSKIYTAYEKIMYDLIDYQDKLLLITDDELQNRYLALTNTELTGIDTTMNATNLNNKEFNVLNRGRSTSRVNIVGRIKRKGAKLIKLLNNEIISFNSLPDDIRKMFKVVPTPDGDGTTYELRPETYSVGRGAAALPGTANGRIDYVGKKNMADDSQTQKHDTSRILSNDERLGIALDAINRVVAENNSNKNAIKYYESKINKGQKKNDEAFAQILELHKNSKKLINTRFAVKNKHTADIPAKFEVQSSIEMPSMLKELIDTAMSYSTSTNVKFVSKNEDGKVSEGERNFNSISSHEINNWQEFYASTKDTLINMSRQDAMDIIDFMENGNMISVNGPGNRLAAYNIFILGFIVDAARTNSLGWNFSSSEVTLIEKLYERRASEAGSALNAVSQMCNTVNPFKRVTQKMLENYNISEDELKDLLATASAIQKEKDQNLREAQVKKLTDSLDNIERLMATNEILQQVFGPFAKDMIKLSEIKDKNVFEQKMLELRDKYSEENIKAKMNKAADKVAIHSLDGTDTGIDEDAIKSSNAFDIIWPIYKELLASNYDTIGANAKTLSVILDNSRKKTIWKKAKSVRYSAMLSSPITWIRNIVSNYIVKGFTKGADTIGSIIFNKKGYTANQWDLTKVQVTDEVKNFIANTVEKSTLFTALYENTNKYDEHNKDVSANKDLFVSMLLNAIEQKYAAEHRFDSNVANNITIFLNKMISDKRFVKAAAEKYLSKILTIEIQRGNIKLDGTLSNNIMGLFAEAVILANNDYMHKQSFLAQQIGKLRNTNPVAYEVLTFWQPFINSSFNWFKESLKYSPIGLINSIRNMANLEHRIEMIDAKRAAGDVLPSSRMTEYLVRRDVGKGVIGSTLMTLGILLATFGIIKLEEDDDKFYIIAGDVRFDISNIFASSSVLVGASIAQLWMRKDTNFMDMMSMTTNEMFNGFILNDLISRHRWNEGIWDAFLTEGESVLRSIVPQIAQLMIRATSNKKISYSSGIAGIWERWLNTFVPTQPFGTVRINPYSGKEETRYALPVLGEFLKSGILGPKIFWSEVSNGEELARKYGINKGELTGELTIDGNRYTLDKVNLNKIYGELNEASMSIVQNGKYTIKDGNVFKQLSWNAMTDEQRGTIIDRLFTQNAKIAKAIIWTQYSNKKYYTNKETLDAIRRLGFTKNVYLGDKGFVE